MTIGVSSTPIGELYTAQSLGFYKSVLTIPTAPERANRDQGTPGCD